MAALWRVYRPWIYLGVFVWLMRDADIKALLWAALFLLWWIAFAVYDRR
jgi:hypothetical protein